MVQGIKQVKEECLNQEYSIYIILMAPAVKSAIEFNLLAMFYKNPQGGI